MVVQFEHDKYPLLLMYLNKYNKEKVLYFSMVFRGKDVYGSLKDIRLYFIVGASRSFLYLRALKSITSRTPAPEQKAILKSFYRLEVSQDLYSVPLFRRALQVGEECGYSLRKFYIALTDREQVSLARWPYPYGSQEIFEYSSRETKDSEESFTETAPLDFHVIVPELNLFLAASFKEISCLL